MIHEGLGKKLYFLFTWHVLYAAIKLTLLTFIACIFCNFILCFNWSENEINMLKSYTIVKFLPIFRVFDIILYISMQSNSAV